MFLPTIYSLVTYYHFWMPHEHCSSAPFVCIIAPLSNMNGLLVRWRHNQNGQSLLFFLQYFSSIFILKGR
jgi:hypothetical protein